MRLDDVGRVECARMRFLLRLMLPPGKLFAKMQVKRLAEEPPAPAAAG